MALNIVPPPHEWQVERVAQVHPRAAGESLVVRACVVWDLLIIAAVCWVVGLRWGESAVVMMVVLLVRATQGVYHRRFHISAVDGVPRETRSTLIASGAVGIVAAVGSLDVGSVVRATLLTGVLLLIGRFVAIPLIDLARRRGLVRSEAALVGEGVVAERMAHALLKRPEYGVRALQRHGRLSELTADRQRGGFGTVILSQEFSQGDSSTALLADLLHRGARVYVFTQNPMLVPHRHADDEIAGVPLIRLRNPSNSVGHAAKRAIDVTLASMALLVVTPVLLVAGFLVSRETGGGILFRQQRIGRDGVPFELLKLQTLRPETSREGDTQWNIAQDERLGPIGRLLRKTSIDELPQLWNVIRGDMSIVGPRPERPHFVAEFSSKYPHYEARHRMAVGLTGLAQINGLRGDTCIDERATFDNAYIDSWSLWQDLRIILRTAPCVLRGEGE